MSVEAIVWALRGNEGRCIETTGDGKHVSRHAVLAVLICLAEHADQWGRGACPSQRTIADETGLDRRQVQHALKRLVADHLITAVAPAVPRQKGTTFTLHLGGDTPAQLAEWRHDLGGDTPAQSVPNSAGDSAGDSAGIPPHEPEPEHVIHPRDSYASPNDHERRLTVAEIRAITGREVDDVA